MAKEYASKGVAGTGLGLGIAGTTLGLLGNGGYGNGLLNNLFGNGCAGRAVAGTELQYVSQLQAENAMLKSENYADKVAKETYAQTLSDNKDFRNEMYAFIKPIADEAANNRVEVAVLKTQIEKDKEITQLKIDKCCCETDKKIQAVAHDASCGISQLGNAVAQINQILGGITKLNIPASAICPEVMPRYNSWTAPTNTPPTA